jgi:nucleotide-binding universal stress UspA family protein
MVVQDRPADLLLAMSARAQLLVVGRSERGTLLAGVAGSPVDTLLRAHWCPIVVVPPGGPPRTTWLPSRSRGWAISHL